MPNNFLGDLSEGIFERLGGLRKEQETKDEQQKLQTLQLLSSLSDQIEPESKPLLMRHIGDVIGLKGKMKGFWNAFSGLPDRSIEDQLGTKLKEVSSGMVGSETAKKAREGGDLARLFQPMSPIQEANRNRRLQAEQGLQGKMIFRDPRQEKLQEIEQRYGAQLTQNLQLKDIQHRNELEKQAESYRLKGVQDQVRYNQKIFLARDRVAESLFGSGKAPDINTARAQADAYLANKGEAELDSILAMTGLRKALEGKAQTEKEALEKTGGLKQSDVMAQRRFDKDQQKEFRTLQSEHQKAIDLANSFNDKIKEKERQLDNFAKGFSQNKGGFDPKTRNFYGISPMLGQSPQAMDLMNDYSDLLQKEKVAKGELKTKSDQIRTQFSEFVEPDSSQFPEWNPIQLKKEYGGVAPAGAPRTGKQAIPPQKPSRPELKAGIGTASGRLTIPVLDPMKYEVGGKFTYRGKRYKIIGLQSDAVIVVPE